MSISTTHPLYAEYLADWIQMSDSYAGERRVKEKHLLYLPATPGQIEDGLRAGQDGETHYKGYKTRARFPSFVSQAVEALLGIMHAKPATIELPAQMEALRENATVKGESLQMLLRRINEHQLVTGRLGLLADVANDSTIGTMPYIAIYKAQDIINWDDGKREELVYQVLNMVVLDESEFERVNNFDWKQVKKYRLLVLGELQENAAEGTYQMGVYREDGTMEFDENAMIVPSIGGTTLSKLPFVVINSKDIVADPDDPPLLGLSQLAMTVYRGEADYRQAIFMQGQDTLVLMGGDGDNPRIGAGAVVNLPINGDAKYVGVQSKGLPEMRKSLENDRAEAAEIGGKLLDSRGGEAESGDALRIRVSARTASLNQIAQSGAEGLQSILRTIATWIGANPEEVIVEANRDFADDQLDGQTLVQYMTAKSLGAPLSKRSIHRILQEKDLTEMEFEAEMIEIEGEAPEPGEGTGVENEPGNEDD